MELMSGNEAIAQGAWEAGARIGVAYPGTPSTETLEAFAKKDGVYAEWCVNEKVAVEVGIGASVAGARVLSTICLLYTSDAAVVHCGIRGRGRRARGAGCR